MMVPVAVVSAKELETREEDKVTGSLTLVMLTVKLLLAVLIPSVAVKVKL